MNQNDLLNTNISSIINITEIHTTLEWLFKMFNCYIAVNFLHFVNAVHLMESVSLWHREIITSNVILSNSYVFHNWCEGGV